MLRRLISLLAACVLATVVQAQDALLLAARAGQQQRALTLLAGTVDAAATEPDGTTLLHWAAYHNMLALARALLDRGASANAANEYGATPMMEAAIEADTAMLTLLLDHGADVEAANAEGQTALMSVARTGNVAAAELLLARGAKVDAREHWRDQTALMWAAAQGQPAMLRTLVAAGADVNARSRVHQWEQEITAEPRAKYMPTGGLTALIYAARQDCLECVQVLVAAGADLNLTDPNGVSPLLVATLNAHFDSAAWLLAKGANVNKWDRWGRSALYAAVDYNTIPRGGRADQPSLDEVGSARLIALLLEAGANPNLQLKLLPPFRSITADRGTDLILTVGTTALLRAAKAADVAAIRLLLQHGALPDLASMDNVSPLMAAAGLGSSNTDTRGRFKTEADALATLQILLAAGADVNRQDKLGLTALHGAAFQGWNKVIKLLVDHGASLNAKDSQGMKPVDAALGRYSGPLGRGGALNVNPETGAYLQSLMIAQ
ncbi:MAG: ankyrin repeat domain-containing protein [Pseudomonadota bacterium]